MKYNKIFQYEKSGIQRRSVTVTDDLKVETRLIPKFGLPLLVKELSKVAEPGEYRRINPYKFDTTTDRHVYILYAEPRETGYEIIKKMIIRTTNSKNIKIPEGTFLYDVLDYFREIKLLDDQYKFIGNVPDNIGMTIVDVIDKQTLLEQGFKFPTDIEGAQAEKSAEITPKYYDYEFI